MKLIHFKIVPFIFAGAAFLALNGCDGTTGISSDSGLDGELVTPPVTPSGTAPVTVDDNKSVIVTGAESPEISVDVLANDYDAENDINKTSLQIVGTTSPGDSLVVSGEGVWIVIAPAIAEQDPEVRFIPEAEFRDDPTPISYTISDDTGLVSNEANVTIDYTQTYFENNTLYPVSPSAIVNAEINVTNAVTSPITKVTATVNISGPWMNEIVISLRSPMGTTVVLSDTNYNGTDIYTDLGGVDYTHTTFDDAAAIAITSGRAPFTGTYSPEGALADFVGEDANGTWTLVVEDTAFDDDNNLTSWSITIE